MRLAPNEREQVRGVVAHWEQQYGTDEGKMRPEKYVILVKLRGLDKEAATADDVADVIGNRSWVQPNQCDECGKHTWDGAVVFEQNSDDETVIVCHACLLKARKLIKGASK